MGFENAPQLNRCVARERGCHDKGASRARRYNV
jgi:hypothetical protein